MIWTCCKVFLSGKQFGPNGVNIPKRQPKTQLKASGYMQEGWPSVIKLLSTARYLDFFLNEKPLFLNVRN